MKKAWNALREGRRPEARERLDCRERHGGTVRNWVEDFTVVLSEERR